MTSISDLRNSDHGGGERALEVENRFSLPSQTDVGLVDVQDSFFFLLVHCSIPRRQCNVLVLDFSFIKSYEIELPSRDSNV